MLSFNRPEITDAATNVSAGILRQLRGKLTFFGKLEAAVSHGFGSGGYGVMNKGAHLARLFLGDKLERIEVFNFGGKFD